MLLLALCLAGVILNELSKKASRPACFMPDILQGIGRGP